MTAVPLPLADPTAESADIDLARRMKRPQRHRLLHGYPLAAALPSADAVPRNVDVMFGRTGDRPLLIGVLPHPFCNPQVTGCGYCTFPHEPGDAAKATAVVDAVRREMVGRSIGQLLRLVAQPVAAVYFGGGTANMVDPEPFARLCRTLAEGFDLSGAEVTLEGVPAYFLRSRPRLADVMQTEGPATSDSAWASRRSTSGGWPAWAGRRSAPRPPSAGWSTTAPRAA